MVNIRLLLHPARRAGDRVGHRSAGQHAFVHFGHLASYSKLVMMSRWACQSTGSGLRWNHIRVSRRGWRPAINCSMMSGREAGQVYHAADIAVAHAFACGNFLEIFDLPRLQHGESASAAVRKAAAQWARIELPVWVGSGHTSFPIAAAAIVS